MPPATESPPPIARVEPLTRTRALRGPFDYRLRPDQVVCVGSLLRVPFGGSTTLGVVVELASLYGGGLTLGTAPIGGLRAELMLPGV